MSDSAMVVRGRLTQASLRNALQAAGLNAANYDEDWTRLFECLRALADRRTADADAVVAAARQLVSRGKQNDDYVAIEVDPERHLVLKAMRGIVRVAVATMEELDVQVEAPADGSLLALTLLEAWYRFRPGSGVSVTVSFSGEFSLGLAKAIAGELYRRR